MNERRAAQRDLAQTYAVVSPIPRPVGWEVRYRTGDAVTVQVLNAAPYDAAAARAEAAALLPGRSIIIPRDGDRIPSVSDRPLAAAAPLRAVTP